ncbi:DUF1629 domain-containing protein [Ruminococcus sp.]|jgi:hypothetical protein|uniref:imm11 family protein n=1 Tax=Ruminococcus sp. TaxID=41978 RepID=UPI0025EB0FEB|nr:DUF1629 domain-containing protein [Ruminococcus sp.]
MGKYYSIEASSNVEEYISVRSGMKEYEKNCQMSEFQFLNTNPITVEVDEDSGKVFQDFIYDRGVPIISDSLKNFLDVFGVDYLFYKKVILTKQKLGIEELYWLALPQRINCLNRYESDIDEVLNYADEIVINEDKVGRYDIFKLAGVTNLEIIISEQLAEALKANNFVGIHINTL